MLVIFIVRPSLPVKCPRDRNNGHHTPLLQYQTSYPKAQIRNDDDDGDDDDHDDDDDDNNNDTLTVE